MPAFDHDREAVVARAREAGVSDLLIAGGVDAEDGHRRALRVAEQLDVPVSVSAGIHPHEARLATESIYDELKSLAREGRIVAIGEVGLDFHYDHSPRDVQREVFRRQVRLARRALALGFHVSFSGIVAFPRSETIQAVARTVPEDRLLIETDSPFLAPPPHRGKRNEPAFVVEVARKVAGLRGVSVEAVGAAAKRNFNRLFRRG